ncbi:thioredoxin peroxidase [Leptospira hartskeerlii]|uniref:Thioredoxin peroxidase n=1 Tax=Leptospira hartskeerlii TaxID=2023177 RepID=A0A2M9XFN0_9LEPT|nr:peroxiredoxin [Leptospira hartskeerlii]PJZ26493.1 thioredoxin peroxidase [Leptospira hartskeerlii]PJZ31950.1 thioredoxin peroxidase [Leptospira hartskeerlii]
MPQVTSLAPDFKAEAVIGQQIKEIKLSEYKGKWVVLFFWPLDFTFVCPTEIIEYDAKLDEFKKIGAEVLGVSVDSAFTHLAWKNTPRKQGGLGDIRYPLIADITKSIARDYGVLLEGGMALRGTFIIDPAGVIRQSTINDLPVGRNIDEAIRLVKAFQYVEKHGEVCPANWDEGKKTMKADPEKSKEYFSAVN